MSSKSNKSEIIDTLSTSNKKITEFYKKNPHINFETINCLVIDFLEHMISDLSGSINNSITTDILNSVKDISNELISYKTTQIFSNTQLQSELINMKDILNKLNMDITNSLVVKLVDIKKTYIDEVKHALVSSDATIQTIIEKQNDIILSKTINVINDITANTLINTGNSILYNVSCLSNIDISTFINSKDINVFNNITSNNCFTQNAITGNNLICSDITVNNLSIDSLIKCENFINLSNITLNNLINTTNVTFINGSANINNITITNNPMVI